MRTKVDIIGKEVAIIFDSPAAMATFLFEPDEARKLATRLVDRARDLGASEEDMAKHLDSLGWVCISPELRKSMADFANFDLGKKK